MPSIQIKNVPPETHAVLVRRAKAAHQSLQEYLRKKLIDEAEHSTSDETLDRISRGEGGRTGGRLSFDDAMRLIRAERDSR